MGRTNDCSPEERGYKVSSGMTGNKDRNLKVRGNPNRGSLGKKLEKKFYSTDDPKEK